jgi:hypothetical protein
VKAIREGRIAILEFPGGKEFGREFSPFWR